MASASKTESGTPHQTPARIVTVTDRAHAHSLFSRAGYAGQGFVRCELLAPRPACTWSAPGASPPVGAGRMHPPRPGLLRSMAWLPLVLQLSVRAGVCMRFPCESVGASTGAAAERRRRSGGGVAAERRRRCDDQYHAQEHGGQVLGRSMRDADRRERSALVALRAEDST